MGYVFTSAKRMDRGKCESVKWQERVMVLGDMIAARATTISLACLRQSINIHCPVYLFFKIIQIWPPGNPYQPYRIHLTHIGHRSTFAASHGKSRMFHLLASQPPVYLLASTCQAFLAPCITVIRFGLDMHARHLAFFGRSPPCVLHLSV